MKKKKEEKALKPTQCSPDPLAGTGQAGLPPYGLPGPPSLGPLQPPTRGGNQVLLGNPSLESLPGRKAACASASLARLII